MYDVAFGGVEMKVGDLVECIEPDCDGWLELGKRYTVQSGCGRLVRVGTEVDTWYQRRFKVVEARKKLSEMEPGDRFIGRTGENHHRFVGKCNGGWAVQTPIGSVYVWGDGDEEYEMVSPAPKARPFASGEEFAPHRGRWLKWKDESLDQSTRLWLIDYNDRVVMAGNATGKTWEEAFRAYVFEDGSPFGVVDSVYNGGE